MSPSITVRMLGIHEADVLKRLADDVFDYDLNESQTLAFFADPRHHLAVALHEDRVVGMASAVHYTHPDKPDELWINEVGVSPSYQKKGIGRRLLATLLDHGRTLGCREAWVLTEEENKAARALYSTSGGTEQSVVYVTFSLHK